MDVESIELSRERAVSSEPCSTRPNPFDNDEHSSRKRQRISGGGSRSRSVDTARLPTVKHLSATPEESDEEHRRDPPPPQTPTHTSSSMPAVEPTSSRVTINLRSTRPPLSSSSEPPSPQTPTKMAGHVTGTHQSLDSGDEGATKRQTETPSSSSSVIADNGSPEIELISVHEDESEYDNRSPRVAIIEDEDNILPESDPLLEFPYRGLGEPLSAAVRKIARFLEYGEENVPERNSIELMFKEPVEDEETFCKLRDWIEGYLHYSAEKESSWYEAYLNDREFWDVLPDIVWSLSKRRNFFGPFLSRSLKGRRALSEFLCQFARLSARFVAMDARIISRYYESTGEPILVSRIYLHAFGWLLRKEESPHIGRNLETHYRWNWSDDVSMLTTTFLTAGGTLPVLTRLIQGELALVPHFPRLIDTLTEPCRIVNRAVSDAANVLNDPDGSHRQYIETYEQIIDLGYRFFKLMSVGLIPIIEKHVTFLSPEAALAHILGLTNILYYSLAFDGCPARDLLESHRMRYPTLPEVYSAMVISNEWKFEMLKRLIVSGQMQLRVIGVTNMCGDLLSMFTKNKKDDPTSHPVLLHFADFILQNKLVDYIVGIGSHPEIISESFNIVGFLIATKTYTNQQTDIIWQTVMTSQDPRVVDAIVRMLVQIINLYDYESLLYLCKKVEELPLEAFTTAMRDFCERLFGFLVQRAVNEHQPVEAPPYELCVRLIRESSITRPETPMGSLDIQMFASARLRELIVHGPEAQVRNNIYVSCIEDISSRTRTAAGSICALFGLLRQNLGTDLHVLTTNHGLTRLMIEELEFTNIAEQSTSAPIGPTINPNSPARLARRELLLAIINHEPSTINPELGTRLWNLLVGRDARSSQNREIGWQILNSAAKRSSSNVFIVTCFKEHLPTLDPECYTVGSLDFARASIISWLSEARGDLLDDEELSELSGVEQLWRMILKAPANSIEAPAVNMLVELYTDSTMISSMPRARAHSVHLALVSRCLNQLSSAASKLRGFSDGDASGEEEPMIIVASENQIREQELIFTRSLKILREFLISYQSKPQYVVLKQKSPILNVSNEVKGDLVSFKYQAFDGQKSGPVSELGIGMQNTIATLFSMIRETTGFKSCKIYHWGKEVALEGADPYATLEGLKVGRGLLLVVRNDDELNTYEHPNSNSSTLELEIIKNFDELWDYLGMEEKLAREIYYFLIKFPVYGKLLAAFEDDTTTCTDIFPLGKPFKCLYAIYALREHLATQVQQGTVNDTVLARYIALIVAAITTRDVLESCAGEDLREYLALHLIECLTQLLREQVPVDSLSSFLDSALLDRLLQLLHMAKATDTVHNSVPLVVSTFEAVLEACFHSPLFWLAFKSHTNTPKLLRELLLDEPRTVLRKSIMKQLSNKCCYTSSLSSTDFAMALWPLLNALISQSIMQPENCEETLSVALLVFRKLADTSIESVDVENSLLNWGSLLIQHKSEEDVGHPDSFDVVSRGLANLLYWCASFAKASQRPLPPNTLAIKIFTNHLFPELSISDDEETTVESLPLLNTGTRKFMADIIIFLTKDDKEQYQDIIELLAGLVPHNPAEEMPYAMELSFGFDRSKSIRSSTGYVGLRNLSNTCYLNSLFTQLFMNVSFRGFMLNAHVADSGTAQKLLHETQKLFAFMQNSLKRFVDPSNLAASIRTYDDTGIDVSVQMDVDEFYNLLFDRWESQILAAGDKRTFRSFYGGQLVQQVKSKECPHISERLEPFSAIQCDIKGKTSLQESLQAYVDGEVMEGDNKYKCSSCDCHVNAVKRACLKDIPDNLIFHLKRFDFNLRTMQRSKINDYFSFPHRLDMRPYKVEHLMESPEQTKEDIYELVGILVHAGTAESGHYYSYIRERPSQGQTPNWVEFNDDTVSAFDPTCIEANCFGGPDYRGPDSGGSFQFDKSYSAYMLFYQRSSVLLAQQQELYASSKHPIRLPIGREIGNFIAEENELLIRKYCLYDEGHAPFVLRILDNIQHINKGRCSEDHVLEKGALSTTLNHLDQVVARTKDLPDFGSYMLMLSHRIQACVECARDLLEWVIMNPEALRQLLFRNPDPMVRTEVASAIVHALSKVKQDANYPCYGLYDDSLDCDDDESDPEYRNPRVFIKVLNTLKRFWDAFHLSTRAWPEYFGLLVDLAQLGTHETATLLDSGFLRRAMEVISADPQLPQHPQYSRMLQIISKRPINKPVSYENVIALLEVLLKACDLNAEAVPDEDSRLDLLIEEQQMPLNQAESALMGQHWTKGPVNILVDKLLLINQNERSTQAIIAMLLHGPTFVHQPVFFAIRTGIRKITANTSVAPFLRAALTYCEHTDSEKCMESMITHITNTTRLLDSSEGREYLQFFKDLLEIPNIRVHVGKDVFVRYVIDQIPIWAPSLLTYYDAIVRTDTEDYVQQTVLRYAMEQDPDSTSHTQDNAKLMKEVARTLGISCLKYLHDEHVRPRMQAVRATLLSIHAIIEQCRRLFCEADGDEIDRQFYDFYQSVIPALRKLTVEVADDDVSEWEGSDDAFSSSEVMESVAELGGVSDLHDPEVFFFSWSAYVKVRM